MDDEKIKEFLQGLLVSKSRIRSNIEASYEMINHLGPEDAKIHIENSLTANLIKEFRLHHPYDLEITQNDRGQRYEADLMVFSPKKLRETLEAFVELHPSYKEMKDKAWKYDQLNK